MSTPCKSLNLTATSSSSICTCTHTHTRTDTCVRLTRVFEPFYVHSVRLLHLFYASTGPNVRRPLPTPTQQRCAHRVGCNIFSFFIFLCWFCFVFFLAAYAAFKPSAHKSDFYSLINRRAAQKCRPRKVRLTEVHKIEAIAETRKRGRKN